MMTNNSNRCTAINAQFDHLTIATLQPNRDYGQRPVSMFVTDDIGLYGSHPHLTHNESSQPQGTVDPLLDAHSQANSEHSELGATDRHGRKYA